VDSGCVVAPSAKAVAKCPVAPPQPPPPPTQPLPLLFLAKGDVSNAVGRIKAQATSAQQAPHYRTPALNYTGGATMFAAFDLGGSPRMYEFFAAVGRPGEPIMDASGRSTLAPDGVSVLRFTTTDFRAYCGCARYSRMRCGSASRGRVG